MYSFYYYHPHQDVLMYIHCYILASLSLGIHMGPRHLVFYSDPEKCMICTKFSVAKGSTFGIEAFSLQS